MTSAAGALRWLCLGAWVAVAGGGCARVLPAQGAEHGNLLAHAQDEGATAELDAEAAALPLVVMVERTRVVAVDPIHGRTRWQLPLVVTGHPVASAHHVVLPIRGNQLAVVERASGHVVHTLGLAGEALTGVVIHEPWIVATVLHDRPDVRGEVLAFSTETGEPAWRRRSAAPLGIPDVAGAVVAVPTADQVIALRLRNGREAARVDVAAARRQGLALERVRHAQGMWLVGGGTRWVTVGGGQEDLAPRELLAGHADAFRIGDRIDDGHSDDERLRLWLRWSNVDATPRDAMVLARRTVVAMRLDPQGQPLRARWLHTEDGEVVAAEVTGERVVLAREDGGIVVLSDSDGRELRRIGGGEPIRGALVLGATEVTRRNPRLPDDPRVLAQLERLLLDADPRLLPAQRIAAELLWRHDDIAVRRRVHALAHGELRGDDAEASVALRRHAQDIVEARWGSASPAELRAGLATLQTRPRFGQPRADVTPAIRQALASARPEVVAELAALLLHPGTTTAELVDIVDVISQLDDPGAIEAVLTFVQRYHADAVIAAESEAMQRALTWLLHHHDVRTADGGSVGSVLQAIADDPLSVPVLRTVVVRGLADLRAVERDDATAQAP
ncbi:MAG: PQQ-binding-like beta-propeller repeat protein [Deltaproteobacteria bacterium]|nr:PQQ-binding-like beta-propeller repeat protein [Deltaproteobacteria bacterium]MBP7287158.1 PQQ-binding-like beta-propeller repeat protein [Nannocystaceae bacterium]